MTVLGYDPDSTDQSVQSRVRLSWPLDEMGSPNWSRTEETVFIRISPMMDEYSRLWDISHTQGSEGYTEDVANHEHYEVVWICYGLNALETANKLRFGLLRESIRQYLKSESLAFKPVIDVPTRATEQDRAGDWWNRFDLRAQCYVLSRYSYESDYIDVMDDLNISVVRESASD